MPGQSGGSASNSTRNASVPPVEAPTQTMLSVVRAMALPALAGGSMASAVSFFSGSYRPRDSCGIRRFEPASLAPAAAFTASQMRILDSIR